MFEAIDQRRRRFLGAAGMAFATISLDLFGSPARLPVEGDLPALHGASTWLNSEPLTKTSLRSKVALVDFWTYSCINWRRSLPYIRAWSERYSRHGLVVIGVHSPEFAFERNVENVRQAAKAMNIGYPIAIDNDYAIWRAFNNQFWPALYFIDAKGRVRHHKFGEGEIRPVRSGHSTAIERVRCARLRSGLSAGEC